MICASDGVFSSAMSGNELCAFPRLVQIEHALAAVNSGTTSLGIKGEYGLPTPHLLMTNDVVTRTDRVL